MNLLLPIVNLACQSAEIPPLLGGMLHFVDLNLGVSGLGNFKTCGLRLGLQLPFLISNHFLGTVGDWKNHFTPKQNRLFEETFKKKMTFSEVAKHLIYEC